MFAMQNKNRNSRCGLLMTLLAVIVAAFFVVIQGHGLMTEPRQRGSLHTQRDVDPQVMDPNANIDYCPHCLNCGGVGNVAKGGPWKIYNPLEYSRKGITMCGDPVGNDDHMRSGTFANPPSMPYAAKYKPGSVANFEYDVTAHHNGFLSFYLCDVSTTGDIENDLAFFKAHCHELERHPHESCESGNDKECGPIDPKFPGRWVLPCRSGKSDQIFGGPSGKMAYKIPNVEIADGVIQSYWLTQNTCNSPDGFMDNYKYPKAWAGCPGDGGSVGARPTFKSCAVTGQVPEEFFSCADVQIGNGEKTTGSYPSRDKTAHKPGKSQSTDPKSTPKPASGYGHTNYQYGATTAAVATTAKTSSTTYPQDCGKGQEYMEKGELVPDPANATCVSNWKQCGGNGFSGPTECCDKRFTCVQLNQYYHQCKAPEKR